MMKKRLMLAVMLILCAALLCGCGQKQTNKYQVINVANPSAQATQNLSVVNTSVPAQDMDYDNGSYDPLSEENDEADEYDAMPIVTEVPVTIAPTVRGEYAGATPVIIDPIDKPTPTPVPPLTFTYQVYDATNIHLSFEAPAGWTISEPSADSFMLTNPTQGVDYTASLTITASAVSSNYSTSDLKSVVKSMLTQIGEAGFDSFDPSNTAERNLLDAGGVYANYTGTLADGAEVAGRVHAVCVNKVLYTVHVTYPKAYTTTYKEQVYDHLRQTISVVQ